MSRQNQAPATEYYIGLMSGTSLDGCDAALVACRGDQVQLVHFVTLPMPEALKTLVQDACSLAIQCRAHLQFEHAAGAVFCAGSPGGMPGSGL